MILHLRECEPEQHPDWRTMPYSEALEAHGELCPATQYMRDELFPDEEVWAEEIR